LCRGRIAQAALAPLLAAEPIALVHLAPYTDSFPPLMDQPALARFSDFEQLLRD
jgi:hypothetical protein